MIKKINKFRISTNIFVVILIISTNIAISVFSVKATYYYDFNYDSRLDWGDDECNDCADFVNGLEYGGVTIEAYVYEDLTKYTVTVLLLGSSKVFHQASHGYYYLLTGENYLLTHDNEEITKADIPDLSDVMGYGGNELLGFGSACYSGTDHWLYNRLWKGFIWQGSLAYMGYQSSVGDFDAYNFAVHFYDRATQNPHHTIQDSIEWALDQTNDAVSGNIILYGNGDIYLVD